LFKDGIFWGEYIVFGDSYGTTVTWMLAVMNLITEEKYLPIKLTLILRAFVVDVYSLQY
jgi:hypothetical protein